MIMRKRWAIGVLAMLLAVSPTAGQVAQAEDEVEAVNSKTSQSQIVNLADADATKATRSLFTYLLNNEGKEILFGHQHATTEGIGITAEDGTQSEVERSVGDLPGVFGWDTLSLEGFEKPGVYGGSAAENRDNLVKVMKSAYEQGGVLNLSSHMPNFVTGNDFYDTKGNVISHILPGGDKHADYNAFLDQVADFAHHLKDDRGQAIPVIFRPFHEQNGGWFWWGAPYRTKEEYVEIYRYTVEYLRDVKKVHNFLYAFSPGSPFNQDADTYLETYPGDDYVDILGFDTYYDRNTPTWYDAAVQDARLVAEIAEQKGKISAFTEFGYSNVKPTGTKDLQFFTKLLKALQSDPQAKKMAYMLTWANFSTDSIFVPYRDAPNGLGDHELLPDFQAFYNDPYTAFQQEVAADRPYQQKSKVAKEQPFMHIVSPINNATIPLSKPTTIRVRVNEAKIAKVTYQVEGNSTEHKMKKDTDGFYYVADWTPDASLAEEGTTLTVQVDLKDGNVLTQTVQLYVSDSDGTTDPWVVDQFETYKGSNELLDRAYVIAGDPNTVTLSTYGKNSGKYGLKYDYTLNSQGYTGESKNMQNSDWSGSNAVRFWMKPDGSNNKLVIQININGTSFEAYPSLHGTEAGMIEIPFTDFKPAPWDTTNADKVITASSLKDVRMFSIYVNKGEDSSVASSTLYFDDIEAYNDGSTSVPE